MGLLRSDFDFSTRRTVAGILLGQPITTLDDSPYGWDDPRLPDGVILEDGTVVPDPAPGSE